MGLNVKENHAVAIMSCCKRVGRELNKLAEAIEKVDDVNERQQLRRALAELMGAKFNHIERHIIELFPRLDPDRS